MNTTIYALIVEDVAEELKALQRALETCDAADYIVFTAMNGIDAISIAAQNPQLDILLMDINLGEGQMNGIEAAFLIRKQNPRVALTFVSAYDKAYYKKSESVCDPDNWLSKPFNLDNIHTHVSQTLKIKERLLATEPIPTKITVEDRSGQVATMKTIDLNDVLYITAHGGHGEQVKVVLFDKTELVISKSLKAFEQEHLYYTPFLRIHKSYLVNFKNDSLEIEYSQFRTFCDKDRNECVLIANGKIKKPDMMAFKQNPYDRILKAKILKDSGIN